MTVDYEEGRRLWETKKATGEVAKTGKKLKAFFEAADAWSEWIDDHAEALLNPDPWRPISELPEEWKDGRELLFAVRYDIQELEPHTDYWIDHWDGESGLRMWGSFIHIPLPPTHFRELKGPGQ